MIGKESRTLAAVPAINSTFGEDEARAHKSDPLPSHVAADLSKKTKKFVADRVMVLVLQNGSLSGTEANEMYRRHAARYKWPIVAWDSPRKRLQELCNKSRVLVCLNADDPRGIERRYALPAETKAAAA